LRTMSSTMTSTSARSSISGGAHTRSMSITVNVERGDAERAYKRLRRIMVSEGMYKDVRATTEGHRKPSEWKVLARKERERRTYRSKLNSKLGWIMRQKDRGF
jgi:ribosomal protein S21